VSLRGRPRRGALTSRHKLPSVAARLLARRRAKIVPTSCPASLRGETVPTSCSVSLRGLLRRCAVRSRQKLSSVAARRNRAYILFRVAARLPARRRAQIVPTSCPASLRGEIVPTSCSVSLRGLLAARRGRAYTLPSVAARRNRAYLLFSVAARLPAPMRAKMAPKTLQLRGAAACTKAR
jgi:hypothetical protein